MTTDLTNPHTLTSNLRRSQTTTVIGKKERQRTVKTLGEGNEIEGEKRESDRAG